jgi:magnesium chelatase family protein
MYVIRNFCLSFVSFFLKESMYTRSLYILYDAMCIYTILPWGVDGKVISVEIDSNRSLPGIDIIGLADSGVKESKDRLRSAFRACNIDIPPYRYIINLSPSDIRKSGSGFDIPIAVALLWHILEEKKAQKEILEKTIFVGEL